MIKVEKMDTWGFEHAVRGMRNSYDSWNKSDSFYCCYDSIMGERCERCVYNKATNEEYGDCMNDWRDNVIYSIGKNDLELMKNLIKLGQSHRKFLRHIFISMDITAPLYWWKEFDTYKVGTTANSCSTMHTIHEKEFTLDDFSHEYLGANEMEPLKLTVIMLNINREIYTKGKRKGDKTAWWQMIQLLPSSYNQKRTVTMNYENALNMIEQRADHKLDEWRVFVDILKNLPYANELFNREDE